MTTRYLNIRTMLLMLSLAFLPELAAQAGQAHWSITIGSSRSPPAFASGGDRHYQDNNRRRRGFGHDAGQQFGKKSFHDRGAAQHFRARPGLSHRRVPDRRAITGFGVALPKRFNCHPVTNIEFGSHGRRVKIRGTMCTDRYGFRSMVPGSRYIVRYY